MRNFLVFFVGGSTGGLIFAGAGVRPAGKPRFLRYDKPRVGADSTAPAGAFRRPTGPQVRLLGRRYRPGLWRRKHPRADMESAPTANGKRRGEPGNRELYVITNSCRGRCSHRPGNPAAPEGPREGHGPPLQTMANNRPPGAAITIRATVGRDALIPPHPAAPQTSAGGYGIRPYGQRQTPQRTGKPRTLRYNKPL